ADRAGLELSVRVERGRGRGHAAHAGQPEHPLAEQPRDEYRRRSGSVPEPTHRHDGLLRLDIGWAAGPGADSAEPGRPGVPRRERRYDPEHRLRARRDAPARAGRFPAQHQAHPHHHQEPGAPPRERRPADLRRAVRRRPHRRELSDRDVLGAPDGRHLSERSRGPGKCAANAKPGDVRYVDRNGDGQINLDDRYAAGSAIPDVTGGLFLDGHYRRVDFTVNLRGSAGGKIFNVARYWTDRMDDISNFRQGLSPWSPTNPSTTTPRAVIGPQGASNANPLSD